MAAGDELPLRLRRDTAAVDFVGRAPELERLAASWQDGGLGPLRVALIGGEPGIGKTRLVAELAARVTDGGGHVAYGGCDEFVRPPYQPFVEALAALVAECESSELQRVEAFARLVPDGQARLPGLSRARTADADADRYLLFEAASRLLAEASRRRPELVVLDDLHWASDGTLLLLRHLVRAARPGRALVVGTFRDTEVETGGALSELLADLRAEPTVTRISVGGFDETDVERFVARAAGHELDVRGTTLASALHVLSGGNPFFITEVLRHLVESGALYQRDGRWVSDAESVESLRLPESVRALVLRRLDRLDDEARRVLTVAAVAGASFTADLLEHATSGRLAPVAVVAAVERAVDSGLVMEDADGTCRFAHALVRQALLDDISATRRAQLHGHVGGALERVEPADHGALAHHFGAAGRPETAVRAAEHSLLAGRAALAGLAFDDAAGFFQRGEELLEGTTRVELLRAELLIGLADVRDATGDVAGMKEAAFAAAHHARNAKDAVRLAAAAVRAGRWVAIGTPDEAIAGLCAEALAALDAHATAARLAVELTLLNHAVYAAGSGAAARDQAARALRVARDLSDDEMLGIAISLRAASLISTDRVTERLALADELVALGERTGDPRSRLDGHLIRGGARLELADRDGFAEDAKALVALGEQLHWWIATRLGCAFEIVLAGADGDWDAAEQLIESSFEGSTNPNDFAGYASQLFLVRREQGRSAELVPVMESLVRDSPGLIVMRAAHALALIEVGAHEEARALMAGLLVDGHAAVPRDQTWMASMVLLSEVAAVLGEHRAAADLLGELDAHRGRLAVAVNGFVCFGAVDRYVGMLEAVRGDWTAAESSLVTALELEERFGAPAWADRTRVWTSRVAARDLGATAHG